MLSKAEMEDIWNNKPVGYWERYKKTLKGTKEYKIKISPYTRNYLPEETFTVRAKNIADAQLEARSMYVTKYNTVRPDAYIFRNVS